MGIPNSQLETWSHQGAQTNAEITHLSIRNAISNLSWRGIELKDYLQGSYRNSTNIYGNSDVDIIVQLSHLLNLLGPQELSRYRQDVFNILNSKIYGKITLGTKSIKVEKRPLNADVVVCQLASVNSVECIRFFAQDGREIINYPKQHLDNGARKNALTSKAYKKTIRIFKKMRDRLIANDWRIQEGVAPSYFIECLLYNVPDEYFVGNYDQTVPSTLNWINQNLNQVEFCCQNGQVYLFGDSPEQWSRDRAATFIDALIGMWDGWGT